MNYENFKEVKSLVAEIDKTKELIEELNNTESPITTDLYLGNMHIIKIGVKSEHECSAIACEFLEKLKEHYFSKLNKLYVKLEKL